MFRRLGNNVGTKEAAGRERGMRAAALLTRVLGLVLAAALLVPVAVAQGASGAKCSPEQGQALIDERRLEQAVREFTCVIDAEPTEVEGYRGRIETQLLLGRYSDALGDYARVTARVLPVHPDAKNAVLAGYAERLQSTPEDVAALTGASFARWAFFDYASAIHLLNRLLEVEPDGLYGNLFRGSSRLLQGGPGPDVRGEADLERAIDLAPESPDVHFVVADAYTYGLPDLERAFAEATLALDGGLDTPRVHAILATAQNAFGELEDAAAHIQRHFELVTTELLTAPSLASGDTLTLDLVPGRAYAIPIAATAGETISISTSSRDYWDSIAVLLAPDGSPVVGSDDDNAYFAAFDWVAEKTGIYLVKVAFFEAVNTGELVVTWN
jgi:tetratricopeptide (TPR) repeat protein